ncbi:hypothetical protein PspLS_06522 [Pyricularia sp. CBS 133598]|nr:hypothetical protein PspLS_06522 [Pyricularia sp. CBS 133598]
MRHQGLGRRSSYRETGIANSSRLTEHDEIYCRTANGRMPREIIIEAGGLGEEFYIQRGGHHHRHRHGHGGWYSDGPSWKEYDRLKEANDALARERDCLKVELKKARADLSQRDGEICRLKEANAVLCREVEELKKHHGGWDDRCREWRNKWTREKNENETLREQLRVRDEKIAKSDAYVARLLEQIARLKDDFEHWKRYALRVEDENKHLRWKLEYYETAPLRRRRFC